MNASPQKARRYFHLTTLIIVVLVSGALLGANLLPTHWDYYPSG